MTEWLPALATRLARGEACVLVTVAHTVGSTPREAGATMLVGAQASLGSIGGGQLEWLAASAARALLEVGGPPRLMRLALGPSLGQCCGGIVWLALERVTPDSAADWQARADAVAAGQGLQRQLATNETASRWRPLEPAQATRSTAHLLTDGARWELTHLVAAADFPVILFGAGHVGEAVVRALAPLGARIIWVDTRDDIFPAVLPPGVRSIATDSPEAEVRAAPPGSYFLVMTHSHALDFALCEAIFARHDFAWFGLIGSATKRSNFARQFVIRGLDPDRLADLSCPIGIPGIQGKHPAVIALAVAAQLQQVREARAAIEHAAHPPPAAPPLSSLPRP